MSMLFERVLNLERGEQGLRHLGPVIALQVGEVTYVYFDFSSDMIPGSPISSITTAEVADSATNITLDATYQAIDRQLVRLQVTGAVEGTCKVRVKVVYGDGSAVEADSEFKVIAA